MDLAPSKPKNSRVCTGHTDGTPIHGGVVLFGCIFVEDNIAVIYEATFC